METFDGVLSGLLDSWEDEKGLVIGSPELRTRFAQNLRTLADVAPAILQFYPRAVIP